MKPFLVKIEVESESPHNGNISNDTYIYCVINKFKGSLDSWNTYYTVVENGKMEDICFQLKFSNYSEIKKIEELPITKEIQRQKQQELRKRTKEVYKEYNSNLSQINKLIKLLE